METLDLIFYDQHLQKEQGGGGAEGGPRGSKLATLIDIQLEFVAPYGELRGEMQPPKVGGRPGPGASGPGGSGEGAVHCSGCRQQCVLCRQGLC